MGSADGALGGIFPVDLSQSPMRIAALSVMQGGNIVQFAQELGNRTQAAAFKIFESGFQDHKIYYFRKPDGKTNPTEVVLSLCKVSRCRAFEKEPHREKTLAVACGSSDANHSHCAQLC